MENLIKNKNEHESSTLKNSKISNSDNLLLIFENTLFQIIFFIFYVINLFLISYLSLPIFYIINNSFFNTFLVGFSCYCCLFMLRNHVFEKIGLSLTIGIFLSFNQEVIFSFI